MRSRWRAGQRVLPALVLVAVLGACVPPAAPPPPPPSPTAFEAISAPAGATPGGADEWYWAPAPNGRAVTLGVFRPTAPPPAPTTTTTTTTVSQVVPSTAGVPATTTTTASETTTTTPPDVTTTTGVPEVTTTTTAPEVTTTTDAPPASSELDQGTWPIGVPKQRPPALLLLNGGDGFRRLYETLALRLAAHGFTVIMGCWYEHPTPLRDRLDGIACVNGPTWKGMNSSSVADVDALVAAAVLVPNVDPARLSILGHSYGAGVALLRAAAGRPEPVISSSGFVARTPTLSGGLPTDEYAAEVASTITSPVLVMHALADGITPIGQAEALVAALPPENPATTDYFVLPANHGFPWQNEELSDRPGAPMWQRFVEDITAWVRQLLA